MDLRLYLPNGIAAATIAITGSKSETNRLLLLQALYPRITINNASVSDDSVAMEAALSSQENIIDIHHAGTAMRFLTAWFSLQEGREVVLTGSHRMKERPISILVDALRTLGAQIAYTENEGYPPLKITGKQLTSNKLSIQANVSSQYITALLLIGAGLKNGLELTLEGEITSLPYIKMTLALLNEAGIDAAFTGTTIIVRPLKAMPDDSPKVITVESDWSSASYYYSIVALSTPGSTVTLTSYKKDSLQGDSALVEIYKTLGVDTVFFGNSIRLIKTDRPLPPTLDIGLRDTPDIAQTIAVTCFGLGIGCSLTGLHTLKIKETDRLEALKAELEKLGGGVSITNDSLTLSSEVAAKRDASSEASVATYNDHRMAMAFGPLAVKLPLIIQDAGVVSKSYPAFWDDLKTLGFALQAP